MTLEGVKPTRKGNTLTLLQVPVKVSPDSLSLLNDFAGPTTYTTAHGGEATTFTANGPFGSLVVEAQV